MFYVILAILIGYGFGTVPYSYILPKYIKKIDIREYGSKNVGATNVLRTCGLNIALLALFCDLVKGIIAVLIVRYFLPNGLEYLCAFFAILGHCYPIVLKFKGGKGVATAAGMVLFLNPKIFLCLAIIMFSTIYFIRIISICSIITVTAFPILAIVFNCESDFIMYAFLIAFFIIYKHKENINRIIDGTEKRVDFSKKL